MTHFPRDVQEMTPADELVYEALLEAGVHDRTLSTDQLIRMLPSLNDERLTAAVAHLADGLGFVTTTRGPDRMTRYGAEQAHASPVV